MLESIKELFTAYLDSDGKTIKGCRINSFSYWHEYRHKQQMENKILERIWTWLPYTTVCLGLIMMWAYSLVPQKETLILGGYFILPITVFGIGLELDANSYALAVKLRFTKNSNVKEKTK